jgi:acyl-CoA synthetase (AMP-forming)/AMP-acid ligase II
MIPAAPAPQHTEETLAALLSAGDPDRIAISTPDDAVTLTGRALADGVHRLAGALSAAGIGRGDRVTIVLPDGPEFVQMLLSVAAVGAAAAPLNPAYTSDECAFYIDDLAPKLLIVPTGEAKAAREAGAGMALLDLESVDGTVHLVGAAQPEPAAAFAPAEPDDIALLLHTSGTTSRPKQVPLRHRNLLTSARAIAEHYRLTESDVSFAAMPLFHVHGLVASVLAPLVSGGRVIAPRRLAPSQFWTSLCDQRVTWFSGSPTILKMLLDRRPDSWSAPSLRFARACSAPLSRAFADRVEGDLGVPILQAYGMTEASHQISSNPLPPGDRDPGSVGLATGTVVTTLDPNGNELPPGTAGELAIRGPGVTSGYLANPEANAASFTGGWFRTGDLGTVDERGYVRIEGRLKEIINRGGEKISPYEVEDVLREHPAVADVACFAVPDEKYGEVVAAAVVFAEPTDIGELIDRCRQRLAAFKVPRDVWPVDSLPRTATGKVQRHKLAADLVAPRE